MGITVLVVKLAITIILMTNTLKCVDLCMFSCHQHGSDDNTTNRFLIVTLLQQKIH